MLMWWLVQFHPWCQSTESGDRWDGQTNASGSVIVDVAVDQGGVIETADRVTTHDEPVYEKYGVLHYAVANIPGAVAVLLLSP